VNCRQGVQVCNEIERLLMVLQLDVLSNGSKVVTKVETTSGLDSRENAHSLERTVREQTVSQERVCFGQFNF